MERTKVSSRNRRPVGGERENPKAVAPQGESTGREARWRTIL